MVHIEQEENAIRIISALVASLKRQGVSDAVIEETLREVVHAESS